MGVPSGQLGHLIEGKGLYVASDGANFASIGCLGDPSMRFTYGYGKVLTYGYGKVQVNENIHLGCSHVGEWRYSIQNFEPRGSACAELYEHDWRILVARQCHFVS